MKSFMLGCGIGYLSYTNEDPIPQESFLILPLQDDIWEMKFLDNEGLPQTVSMSEPPGLWGETIYLPAQVKELSSTRWEVCLECEDTLRRIEEKIGKPLLDPFIILSPCAKGFSSIFSRALFSQCTFGPWPPSLYSEIGRAGWFATSNNRPPQD